MFSSLYNNNNNNNNGKFECYFTREHIALSLKKNKKNGVNIELGKTNRLKALCMMQDNN